MVCGVYIDRAGSDRLLLRHALDRYLREVSSTKRVTTSYAEGAQGQGPEGESGGLQSGCPLLRTL